MLSLLSSEIAGVLAGTLDAQAVIQKVLHAIGDLNEEFVQGCLDKTGRAHLEQYAEDMAISDWVTLFNAALAENPIEGILELEKNSPAGVLAQQLMPKSPALQNDANSPPAAGGDEPSIGLFDPAGGSQS